MGKFGLAPATLVYENGSLAWEIVGRRSGGATRTPDLNILHPEAEQQSPTPPTTRRRPASDATNEIRVRRGRVTALVNSIASSPDVSVVGEAP
jgi:hypothetical protein